MDKVEMLRNEQIDKAKELAVVGKKIKAETDSEKIKLLVDMLMNLAKEISELDTQIKDESNKRLRAEFNKIFKRK